MWTSSSELLLRTCMGEPSFAARGDSPPLSNPPLSPIPYLSLSSPPLILLFFHHFLCFLSSDAFDLQYAVVVFRLRAGFDVTDHSGSDDKGE